MKSGAFIVLVLALTFLVTFLFGADKTGSNQTLRDNVQEMSLNRGDDNNSHRVINTWDGSYNTNWHNALNWDQNHAPLSTEDVIIPDGLVNYPEVTGAAECNNLLLSGGTSLSLTQDNLHIHSDCGIYGTLSMSYSGSGNSTSMAVEGILAFNSGSSVDITYEYAMIVVLGNIRFNSGSDVNMTDGVLVMSGSENSYIEAYSPATIYNLRSSKDATYISGLSGTSTSDLTITGDLEVYDESRFIQYYGGNTILKGNLSVQTGGICACNVGTLSMEGISNSYINLGDEGNYLHNLRIYKTGMLNYTVTLHSDIDVRGDLIIDDGILETRIVAFPSNFYYDLEIGGDWDNNAGAGAFKEYSAMSVTFNGTGEQILNSETFSNLILDKSSGTMVIPEGSVVTCSSYDWVSGAYSVTGGTFNVNDIATYLGIFGTITLDSGTINYHQDTDTGSSIDLRANLTINGGTFNVYGGFTSSYIGYVGEATLNMSDGILDFKDHGIRMFSTYNFNENITGGTIRTVGSLIVNRSDYNPTGGTTELYGDTDCTLDVNSGSNLFRLFINKSSARNDGINTELPEWQFDSEGNHIPITRNNTVTATTNLDINAGFELQAGTFIAPAVMNVAAGWRNEVGPEFFVEGTGLVILDSYYTSHIFDDEVFYNLEIDKNPATCTMTIDNGVDVVCESYDWTAGNFAVAGGTFTAYDLADNGIYGGYTLSSGTINLHQDEIQYADLNAELNISGGTFNIYGGYGCIFSYDEPATLNMSDGVLDIHDTNAGINVTHEFYENITGGTIRFGKSFGVDRDDFNPTGGTIEMYGPLMTTLTGTEGSNFHNLVINKDPGTGVLGTGMHDINGDFTIMSGAYNAPSTINVAGDWHLYADAIFNPNTGTVTFDLVGLNQNVYGHNTFYNVIDAHIGLFLIFDNETIINGTLSVSNIVTFDEGATLNNVVNDISDATLYFAGSASSTISSYTGGGTLLCAGNHVVVSDLAQNGLYGSFEANNGHLEIYQDPSSFTVISGSIEIINDGIIDIYGGNTGALFAYSGDVSFTMDSGEFKVMDGGLTISDTAYLCDFDISGGTISLNGSWLDERSYAVFDPSGGTVEFIGSSDNYVTAHPDGWFQNLTVNKEVSRNEPNPPLRSCNLFINACTVNGALTIYNANVVSLGGDVSCQNAWDVTVNNGTLDLNGHTLTTTGNIIVNGTLALDPEAVLKISPGKYLTVNDGGNIECLGNSSEPATITHNSSSYYGISIESGATVSAVYTIFEYLNAGGMVINDGAWVDPSNSLDYCTFRYGFTSLFAQNERLLTINNDQHLIITGASFPNLPAQYPSFCVAKTLDQGSVYFEDWSGNYGGPSYEYDDYNRIFWEGVDIPPVYDLSISYISGTEQIQLDWTYPLTVSHYKIWRSDDPEGTFILHDTSSTNTWTEFVSGPIYFYRVTAVTP